MFRTTRGRKLRPLALLGALTLVSLPVMAEVPTDPPTFSDPLAFDNEYFPFQPGGIKILSGFEDGARIVIMDLYHGDTRTFQWGGGPVECRILEEVEFEDGELAEISLNYFGQADDGTAYYFGEVVDDYEDGEVVSHGGSWLVGGATLPSDPVDTAVATDPAVFMPADPEVGDTFKPEDLYPFVDETAVVVRDGFRVRVPAGTYEDAILVRETSRLSSGVEYKTYAPGQGVARIQAAAVRVSLLASTLITEEEEEVLELGYDGETK